MERVLWCVLVAVLASLLQPCAGASVTVTVDPVGGDDMTCLSLQDLADNSSLSGSTPSCRTLNRALGALDEVSCQSTNCTQGDLDSFSEEAIIFLADGEHRLKSCVGITRSSNIRFQAVNEGAAVVKCASRSEDLYSNMFVCDSRNISFHGLVFQGCNLNSSNVFFRASMDITFESCEFRNNDGSPLQFRFSTGIRLIGCRFLENVNQNEAAPDTEDTSIVDIYDVISTAGAVTIFARDHPVDILIQGCTFTSNNASRNAPSNTRPVLLKANGHGGAILIRLVGSEGSSVVIEDNVFTGNVAEVDGGAVYLSMSEDSTGNDIVFRNNSFSENTAIVASGGAVSINSFNFTFRNTMLVDACNFTRNRGDSGGAFSMALYNSNVNSTRSPDTLLFRGCNFISNEAENEGTAVGLFSLVHVDQVGFPVYFQDCTFRNNTSLETAQDTSAIAAFRFPTVFSGSTQFEFNIGGGITLLNTRMRVTNGTTLLFRNNTAVFGAGISMDDRCLLELSNDVNLTFEGNVATESGGGIYVEFPPIRFVVDIFNRLCFLQYNNGSGIDAPPQEWNGVEILFAWNRARLSGAAIFASDMQQCGWLGSEYTTDNSLIFDPPEELRVNYPFQYRENSLFPEGQDVITTDGNASLATSPANIYAQAEVVTEENQLPLVQPGERVHINLLAKDQINNNREAIWSVEAPGVDPNLDALSANNDSYPYDVPAASVLAGTAVVTPTSSGSCDNMMGGGRSTMEGGVGTNQMSMEQTPTTSGPPVFDNFSSTFTLNFSLLRTLGTVQPLTLNVSGCHPGYSMNDDNMCECDLSNNAILRCDTNARYLYLREGIWGGFEEENGVRKLITARVRPGYVECHPQGRLPGCLFMFDNVSAQCSGGRQGDLCGQCANESGVTLDLTACSSASCNIGLGLFIVLCVSVLVVSSLILLFDIGIPNEIKGFVFYAQVVGLVYSPYVVAQTDSSNDASKVLRILLNLLGLSVPLPVCLHESLRAHHVALLGYVSPVLTVLTIALFVLGTRYIRALGNHSALKGITFLSLFVYKYVADTAFLFISCVDTDQGLLFQYDGSLSCLANEFWPLALLGLILVAFFVVPTPLIVSYICVRRPLKFQQYADVLTKGLRTKHHWWGGWDIFRRLPFVFIGFFIVIWRPSIILFLMSLAALGVLLVHLFTKPFEKMYINVIEAAILLDLLLVTVAFLDPSNTPVPFELSIVLLLLPYAYAICFIFYTAVGKKLWKRMMVRRRLTFKKSPPSDTAAAPSAPEDRSTNNNTSRSQVTSSTTADNAEGQAPPSQQGGGARRSENASAGEVDYIHYREPLLDDDWN